LQKFTEDQELYLKKVLTQLEEGGLPKQTAKSTLKALNELGDELVNPFKVLATLRTHIPDRLLQSHYAEHSPSVTGKREVILSLYLSACLPERERSQPGGHAQAGLAEE